jgi:hypothetical protein
MSIDDITSEFLSAIRLAGFEPGWKIVADGKIHRFRDWLDKPGVGMYFLRIVGLLEPLVVVGVAYLIVGQCGRHDL